MSLRFAHFGLLSFGLILATALTLIVAGSTNPQYAAPLKIGGQLPEYSLYDEAGAMRPLALSSDSHTLLVFAPPNGLCSTRREGLRRVRDMLSKNIAFQTIAIASNTHAVDSSGIRALCSSVLLDPQATLWPLSGAVGSDAAICLIDPHGHLRYRVVLPENPGQQEDPIDALRALVLSGGPLLNH